MSTGLVRTGPAAPDGQHQAWPHHDQAWAQWQAAMAGSRLHHAWLLAGRQGLGKGAFARRAARALLAEPGVPQPAGEHPDIIILTHLPRDETEARKRDEGKPYETRRSLAIDQVRMLQQRLVTRPSLGNRRVVIIEPADDLETAAANAMLKILEEPPLGTVFLLVTHRPGRLLPTIRSRCRMLRFPDLGEAEMDAWLAQMAPQAEAPVRAAAIAAAAGSPGVALAFINEDLAPLQVVMQRIASRGDRDFSLRAQLVAIMGQRPGKARQQAALDLAGAVVHQRAAHTPRGQLARLVEVHGELTRLAGEVQTYNYDAGLLMMQIGTLLAQLAAPREAGDG